MSGNNLKAYQAMMEKYLDDNIDDDIIIIDDSESETIDEMNTHLIHVRSKTESRVPDDESRNPLHEEERAEGKSEVEERQESDIMTLTSGSPNKSPKLSPKARRQQRCSLYRELYTGEQWNIDQLTEQLFNVIEEVNKVPERLSLYLPYYLKSAQSICSAIERRDLYGRLVARLLTTSPEKPEIRSQNLKSAVPVFANMNIHYTMESIALTIDHFRSGYLFGIIISDDEVSELPVIELKTEQKSLSLPIDQTFKNIKQEFEFVLKLYFRSNRQNFRATETVPEAVETPKNDNRKSLSSSLFRRLRSIRRIHENFLEKDKNSKETRIQTPCRRASTAGPIWNWSEGLDDGFFMGSNPTGFQAIAQTRISGKNLLKTNIELETLSGSDLFHKKVFVSHRTLACRDQ